MASSSAQYGLPISAWDVSQVSKDPWTTWAVSEGIPYWELAIRISIRLFFIPSSNSAEQSILDVNVMDL